MHRRQLPFLLPLPLAIAASLIWGCGGDDTTSQPPPPCNIEFVSPTGSECLVDGDLGWIDWDNAGGGNVRIDLFKADSHLRTIYSRTANDGLASWTVNCGGQPTGSDYKIRITSLRDPDCTDTSEPLRIVNPVDCEFTLIRPNPLRPPFWTQGDTVTIEWESLNTCEDVSLRLLEGNRVLAYIATRTPNDGSHRWAVEAYATGNIYYLFEICDADIEQCHARAGVRIEGVRECELIVRRPLLNDDWYEGSTELIVWESNFIGPRKLTLWWAPSGEIPTFLGTIVDGLEDDQPYAWTVTTFGHGPGRSYRIQVEESMGICDGYSSSFKIQ